MSDPSTAGRVDRLGSRLAADLLGLIDGLPVGAIFDVLPSADIAHCLELFIPRALRAQHPEWENESLDGIFVARARKTGLGSAEFVGVAILIRDQCVTPFAVEVGVGEGGATVTVRSLNLGEPGRGPLGISGPPSNSKDAQQYLASLLARIDDVAWSYTLHAET